MSGDRTGPLYDVVATARRSWTRTQKLAIVAELGVGEATLSEVARRHGIHASLLFRWRRDLGAKAGNETLQSLEHPARPALSFIPVVVPPAAVSPSTPPATRCPAKADLIEIVLAGGRVLRVSTDVDTAALLRVVRALEADPAHEGRR